MVKCPSCSTELVNKEGTKKLCAQIGNPEIAVVETEDPCFCTSCNEYFLDTKNIIKAIKDIKELKSSENKEITKGIYS